MVKKTRSRHQDMFLMEVCRCAWLQPLLGYGYDKPDVTLVIHHRYTQKYRKLLIQETGRLEETRRGTLSCLFTPIRLWRKLAKNSCQESRSSEQEIGNCTLASGNCGLRLKPQCLAEKFILSIFWEEFDEN